MSLYSVHGLNFDMTNAYQLSFYLSYALLVVFIIQQQKYTHQPIYDLVNSRMKTDRIAKKRIDVTQ